MSHPSRGAWIEITWDYWTLNVLYRSHPSRGAWIEIPESMMFMNLSCWVAPLAGCVD